MSKLIKVTLTKESAKPGLLACGPYRVGKEYEVPIEEAVRLARFKGFVCAGTKKDSDGLAKAIANTVKAEEDAAAKAEEAAKESESQPAEQVEE